MWPLLAYAFTGVLAFLVYLVIKAWKTNQYWKNLNVPHPKPVLFFGNLLDLVLKRRTQAEIISDIFWQLPNEPLVGYYNFMSPRIIIRDQELVERVLIKDFQHFVDRTRFINTNGNPLMSNLFSITGNHWRAMRSKLVPMFTTGKLRYMLPQINCLADELVKILEQRTDNVDMKDPITRFAMEVISSTAFGIESGTLDGEDTEFSRESKIAFSADFFVTMKRLLFMSVPKLGSIFNMSFMPKRTIVYYTNVIRRALEDRRSTGLVRNDFVQQMVTLLDKGHIEFEKVDHSDDYLEMKEIAEENMKIKLTDDMMIGHAFLFLLAGFETTATSMTYLCLELAVNQNAQQKVREEVVTAKEKHGELTFDRLKDLSYLEWCMKESLRLHPPVGHLIRNCTKRYAVPGSNMTIEPDTVVTIPTLAIHNNPDIYDKPQEFLPERWNGDVSYPPCSFLPFGDGPRVCIGMRFAIMEIKCCIAKLLQHYKLSLHPSVKLPIKTNPYSFFGGPTKPIMFNITRIER